MTEIYLGMLNFEEGIEKTLAERYWRQSASFISPFVYNRPNPLALSFDKGKRIFSLFIERTRV